jgi:hypothetical protein
MSNVARIPDPGPLARWNVVKADEMTMPIVVQRIADGETLKQIAKAWQVPYGLFAQWLIEDRERSEQYNAALKLWMDSLAQETVQIADEQAAVVKEDGSTYDPNVQRDKLRIDTRLKLAGKLNRERYGDQTDLKVSGSVSLISVLSSLPRTAAVLDATDAEIIESKPAIPAPAAKAAPIDGII